MGFDKTEIHSTPEETPPFIIEYPALVDTVQLSVARLLDIEGSIEADTFQRVQETLPVSQEHLMDEIGMHFDEALVNFVVAALVSHRTSVTIRVEAHEGLDGWLPWENALLQRANMLATAGILRHVQLRIERYTAAETVTQLGSFAPTTDLHQLSSAA